MMSAVPVTDRAIAAIKAMIVEGSLKPGDRLPPEKELSEQVGVSRNSLREAVKALSVIKVLDVKQGDGTYVTSLAPDLLVEAMGFILDLHQDSEALHVIQVRRLLEPAAVQAACERLSPEDLDQLDALMAPLGPNSAVEDLVEADMAFHQLINSRCGNPYLSSLLEGLASSSARARTWRGLTETDAVTRTLDEHGRIQDALRQGRGDLAAIHAAAHVAGVEGWVARGVDPEQG
jgi:GntR family transcriptional repressor for pyruvate dehydrogenase complex